MAEKPESMKDPAEGAGFSIVVVPDDLREQVLAYVKDLSQDEAEVSGYMIGSSMVSRGMAGSVLQAGSSGSGCKFTDSKKGFDWTCFDEDA